MCTARVRQAASTGLQPVGVMISWEFWSTLSSTNRGGVWQQVSVALPCLLAHGEPSLSL